MREDDENSQNNSTSIIGLIIVIAIGWWVYNNWFKTSETWNAYIYTDSSLSSASTVTKQGYSSYDHCLDAVVEYRRTGATYYDHECGKNCEPSSEFASLDVCEDTR